MTVLYLGKEGYPETRMERADFIDKLLAVGYRHINFSNDHFKNAFCNQESFSLQIDTDSKKMLFLAISEYSDDEQVYSNIDEVIGFLGIKPTPQEQLKEVSRLAKQLKHVNDNIINNEGREMKLKNDLADITDELQDQYQERLEIVKALKTITKELGLE